MPFALGRPTERPDRAIFSAGLILAACFLWVLVLPGWVAYHNRVFFSSDIAKQLRNGVSEAVNEDKNRKLALISELAELNRQIASRVSETSSLFQVKTLIDARDKTEQDLKNFKPKIAVKGFYDDAVNVVFVLN